MNKAGRKKIETKVTLANGGMDDTRAWANIKAMIEGNKYKAARLYHICLTPFADNQPDIAGYQSARKALCLKLNRAGIDHQWRACAELDEGKEGKGLHYHLFLMLEGHSDSIPDQIINTMKNGWIRTMMNSKGIQFTINKPKNRIHWGTALVESDAPFYAKLPKSKQEKIDDCIQWISYLVKARSKSPSHKTTYFSSRDKSKAGAA